MGVVKDGSRSVVRTLASIPRRLGGTREEPLRTSAWEATLRDGPLENLSAGGGEVQKKNSRKGKANEKNPCTPINPKNIHAIALKRFIQGIL